MIYIIYLVVAIAIVAFSMKASKYVDMIDKSTDLSGAFLGGIMLSAVTSLPELFTSVSSTVLLNKPGLCIGNILGSNLFNLVILSVLTIIYIKAFGRVHIANSHSIVAIYVISIYVVMALNMAAVLNFEILTVSVTSFIIIVLYVFSIRKLSADNDQETLPEQEGKADQEGGETQGLSLKGIIVRFIIASIGIIALSITITYITDEISIRLNLAAGLAGALFLGIATSLPEVASTVTLFKIKNYNIAVGNIIGSCLFNLAILFVTDVLYVGHGIYDFSEPQTGNLLVFGLIALALLMIILKFERKGPRVIASIGIVACYMAFLTV